MRLAILFGGRSIAVTTPGDAIAGLGEGLMMELVLAMDGMECLLLSILNAVYAMQVLPCKAGCSLGEQAIVQENAVLAQTCAR